MPKEIHFYDTINAIKNYDKVPSNYNYHSFNVTLPLSSPLINLKSIELKSVEIPINLTKPRLSTSFNIIYTYGGSQYQILIGIAYRIYSTIESLLVVINGKISNAISGISGLTISFSTIQSDLGSFCVISHNCSALEIDETPLTRYILGFTIFTTGSSLPLLGQYLINLNAIDTCVYLKFINLPVMNNNNPNGYTFKVPLNNISNGTVFFNDTLDQQPIFFNNSNFVLNKLDIIVVDRLGIALTGYHNWTFTLLIDYYENTYNEPQFLNINN